MRGFLLSFSFSFRYIQSSGNFGTILTSSVISQDLFGDGSVLLWGFLSKDVNFFSFHFLIFFILHCVYFFGEIMIVLLHEWTLREVGDLEKNTSPI